MTTEPVTPEMLHGWAIYLQACEEARRTGDRRAGTDHVLLALFEDPSVEGLLGVSLQQGRQALDSLDREALGALGLGPGADAPELPMRAVPKKPRIRDLAKRDRFRMTPAAKKVLEEAYKPKGHRKLQVTGPEVLAQILALRPPDPAAVLLGALGVNTSDVRRRLDLPGHAGRETSSRSPDADRSDRSDMPVLPTQSQEDTDAGWGEQPEPDDDERLHRERPPHWDSL